MTKEEILHEILTEAVFLAHEDLAAQAINSGEMKKELEICGWSEEEINDFIQDKITDYSFDESEEEEY